MRSPGRSITYMAVLRRFAVVMIFVVLASVGAAVALLTLNAPDWAYLAVGLVITAAAVFRTMEAMVERR